MNNEIENLYQQIILDHSQTPHHFKKLEDAHYQKKGFNPLCGDQLTLYIKVEKDFIQDISFLGSGCAISIASASLMTDLVINQSLQNALILFAQFQELTTTGLCKNADNLGKLAVLASVSKFPMRVKCATLAWHTLKQLIEDGKN